MKIKLILNLIIRMASCSNPAPSITAPKYLSESCKADFVKVSKCLDLDLQNQNKFNPCLSADMNLMQASCFFINPVTGKIPAKIPGDTCGIPFIINKVSSLPSNRHHFQMCS